jgi:hypothetical protein
MTTGLQSHAARPTDLVALVTFDNEVRENQAVTLESLGADEHHSRPFNVALAQWLHLGRRMWVNVDGREVYGIATARDLGARSAWVIDTLIDAGSAGHGDEVISDLLAQAVEAARRASVTQLLLRTAIDASAREPAMQAGFRPVLPERLWSGSLSELSPVSPAIGVTIRDATSADLQALFHLYSRSAPTEARLMLAMTLNEWQVLRERRWFRGGGELLAEVNGRPVATLVFSETQSRLQFELTAEPDAEAAVRTLLGAMLENVSETEAVTLVPRHASSIERVLLAQGFQPDREYVLQSHRLRQQVKLESKVPLGIPVPSGGGA